MRILCLDIGSKRIGVALSDPFGWTAQGLCTLQRRGRAVDLEAIFALCREYDVEKIVVGLPLDAEGKEGAAAKGAAGFCRRLGEYCMRQGKPLPLEGWDERYSTVHAEERLLAADVSRAKRRKVIDKMAAVVILESYLREHAL